MVFFKSGKSILLKGCSDPADYYFKNVDLYKKLYPAHSEKRLRRVALLDWNEMIPEDKMLEGGLEVEKRFIEDLTKLNAISLFHPGAIEDLIKIEKSLEKLLVTIKKTKSIPKRKVLAESIRPFINQAVELIQPSLDAVHSVQLSEEEHINELSAILDSDQFLKSVIRKTDKQIEDSLSSFHISALFGKGGFTFSDMAKKVTAVIEEFKQNLEIQSFALQEILLELNKDVDISRMRSNVLKFKHSISSVKKGIIFFSKIEGINSAIINELGKMEQGVHEGSWDYVDEKLGIPEFKKGD